VPHPCNTVAQRLLDKIERTRLHRRNCQRHRAVTGNKDDWDPPAADVELLLQFGAGHLRHLYIKQ
jgi:hypothetical protein